MTYVLPIEDRLRLAARQRARYWRDDDFRLRCINRYRDRRGLPPLAALHEMVGRQRDRDSMGRFIGNPKGSAGREA